MCGKGRGQLMSALISNSVAQRLPGSKTERGGITDGYIDNKPHIKFALVAMLS